MKHISLKAYSYLRISSLEQQKGQGIERQMKATRAYCKEHDLQLVDNLQDIGLSGYHGDNLKEDAALGVGA